MGGVRRHRGALGRRSAHRKTDCTVVNRRGLASTRLVNMNSKRDLLNLVMRCSACVLPRRREVVVRMVMDCTQA